MADRLIRPGDEGVTVTASALRTLLGSGDGDAALLYLALLRRRGAAAPRALAGELRWDRERIERAEAALQDIEEKTGLIRRFQETRRTLDELSVLTDRLTALTQGEARKLACRVAQGIEELRTKG